ncbi:hypothetical protein C8J57DRAFT_1710419 [Mycena rebaudengoi]|nr:hypothetical protein C8J57DRAFT_1710419 [Mycena rebaudengoi]
MSLTHLTTLALLPAPHPPTPHCPTCFSPQPALSSRVAIAAAPRHPSVRPPRSTPRQQMQQSTPAPCRLVRRRKSKHTISTSIPVKAQDFSSATAFEIECSSNVATRITLDAGTLVWRNFEELFDSPFSFAAVPDVYGAGDARGFSLTFNSGVMAFTPSSRVLVGMIRVLENAAYPSIQADQGFLNQYFGAAAMRLPYVYNANLAIKARSPVLWERLQDEMRVVHYTGVKPFLHDTVPEDVMLSLVQVEEAMTQAEARGGGLFVEEVRWWREAYERMMQVRGREIRACY